MSNEKKSFQISLAWAERELLRSNSISEPIELQARLRASAHSREIERIIFPFGIPSTVTRTVAQLRSSSSPSLYNRHYDNRLDSEDKLIIKIQCEPQEMDLQMKNSH